MHRRHHKLRGCVLINVFHRTRGTQERRPLVVGTSPLVGLQLSRVNAAGPET